MNRGKPGPPNSPPSWSCARGVGWGRRTGAAGPVGQPPSAVDRRDKAAKGATTSCHPPNWMLANSAAVPKWPTLRAPGSVAKEIETILLPTSWSECAKLSFYHRQDVVASLAPAAASRHTAGSSMNTMGFHSLLCGDQVIPGQISCWLSLRHLLSRRVFGRRPTRPNVPLPCSNTSDFEEGVKLISTADGVHEYMQALPERCISHLPGQGHSSRTSWAGPALS